MNEEENDSKAAQAADAGHVKDIQQVARQDAEYCQRP
jgi:hypothetical protein